MDTAGNVVRYVLSALSVPVSLLLMATVCAQQRRRQPTFQSPFFSLLVVISAFDLLHCVKNVGLEAWTILWSGWQVWPYSLTVCYALGYTAWYGALIGFVLIAAQRFVAIVWPTTVHHMWTGRVTSVCIGLQVAASVAYSSVQLFVPATQMHMLCVNGSLMTAYVVQPAPELGLWYHDLPLVMDLMGGVWLALVYIVIGVRVHMHQRRAPHTHRLSANAIRLTLTGVLMSVFIMVANVLYVLVYKFGWPQVEWLYALSITTTHVSTAPIAIAMSTPLRSACVDMLRRLVCLQPRAPPTKGRSLPDAGNHSHPHQQHDVIL